MSLKNLIFVDCEANGPCPGMGELTEFGAVAYESRSTYHGLLIGMPHTDYSVASLLSTQIKRERYVEVFSEFEKWILANTDGRAIMVSDNPAYDFQWINHGFWTTIGRNPFGHSARRISDFYAGLVGDFRKTQDWKRLRVTPHDHNPVHDAMGNVEAFERLLKGER